MKTVLLSVFIILLYTPHVQACKCREAPPVADAYKGAHTVFAGTVISVEKVQIKSGRTEEPLYIQVRQVTFTVSRMFKGQQEQDTIVIQTAKDGAACGYRFEPGYAYIVYAFDEPIFPSVGSFANMEKPYLTTHHCSRTDIFDQREYDALDAISPKVNR